MSKFYVVATPIGNLEDMSLRAIRTLKEVSLILCEDTRTTKKLLNHYQINTPTLSYHQHSKTEKVSYILKLLEKQDLALVSDAGTPCISDPGVLIIQQVREKFGEPARNASGIAGAGGEVEIIPIPGPSALITALSASGILSSEFLFLGFLPNKKGRETAFKEITESKRTVVFYESTHRIMKALESLRKHLDENRKIVIGRELTKMFEQVKYGTVSEVENYFKNNKDKIKGEFVVIVSGK
ncbi:MAG: 16S rRNA (cytidine(1402)-2'-O)-methyltransferase [Candidatus Paceibacterota bacterium]